MADKPFPVYLGPTLQKLYGGAGGESPRLLEGPPRTLAEALHLAAPCLEPAGLQITAALWDELLATTLPATPATTSVQLRDAGPKALQQLILETRGHVAKDPYPRVSRQPPPLRSFRGFLDDLSQRRTTSGFVPLVTHIEKELRYRLLQLPVPGQAPYLLEALGHQDATAELQGACRLAIIRLILCVARVWRTALRFEHIPGGDLTPLIRAEYLQLDVPCVSEQALDTVSQRMRRSLAYRRECASLCLYFVDRPRVQQLLARVDTNPALSKALASRPPR